MTGQPNLDALKAQLRGLMPQLTERYGLTGLKVFGSTLRGEAGPGSDLDLLASFDRPISLLRFVELENLLSDTLGVKVDLVMEDSLKPAIGRRIRAEAQPV
ncbi:MAG: nucleotidyltransferase family protein [Thermodesulfobacteriota bacterium]